MSALSSGVDDSKKAYGVRALKVPVSDLAILAFSRSGWEEPPVCAVCLGELKIHPTGNVYCVECGEVAGTITLQSANEQLAQPVETAQQSANNEEKGGG